jgi:catechol 2,3-dioxygenase-like lactoylglutathione lyase family enzyme
MHPVLTHLALHVRDVDQSIAFYQRYCQMSVVHDRHRNKDRVVWLAEIGQEDRFVIVLIAGGTPDAQAEGDYSHLGFALASRADVERVAAEATAEGQLAWPLCDEAWPTGYYCGVVDPDGRVVEFSHGQPLGPGSTQST